MELTAENVDKLFRECLFNEDEEKTNYTITEGLFFQVGFHPERLKSHRKDIFALLNQLPEEFSSGCSLLKMNFDMNGEEWGSKHNLDELFILGRAIGGIRVLVSRDFWHLLPEGYPYVMTISEEFAEKSS